MTALWWVITALICWCLLSFTLLAAWCIGLGRARRRTEARVDNVIDTAARCAVDRLHRDQAWREDARLMQERIAEEDLRQAMIRAGGQPYPQPVVQRAAADQAVATSARRRAFQRALHPIPPLNGQPQDGGR